MAKTVQLTATVDEEVKNQSSAILNQLGLSMSSAIEIFLRQVIRTRGIPFELTLVDSSPKIQGETRVDHEVINL